LRVKGHGVAARNGDPGDLFAEIEIVLPAPLDEKSVELIKQLDAHIAQTQPQKPRQDLRW
jgi:DnaJ-class molecular chaperone